MEKLKLETLEQKIEAHNSNLITMNFDGSYLINLDSDMLIYLDEDTGHVLILEPGQNETSDFILVMSELDKYNFDDEEDIQPYTCECYGYDIHILWESIDEFKQWVEKLNNISSCL